MKIVFYQDGKVVYEKEMRPESEWEIDPVFFEGVGDDSELRKKIRKYLDKFEDDK